MFDEDDLLPISGLQHLQFCERQCALIHLEGLWGDNRLTVEGRQLHERTHEAGPEWRQGVRIARGLRLRSLKLGLAGQADVVEFHRVTAGDREPRTVNRERQGTANGDDTADGAAHGSAQAHCRESRGHDGAVGCELEGLPGRWRPFPVEYKRGREKSEPWDEVQLCAQAMCLEEMLGCEAPRGALFYGQTRRRSEVEFSPDLRRETVRTAERLHQLLRSGVTPPPEYARRCRSCSLIDQCLPKTAGRRRSAQQYLATSLAELNEEGGG